MSNAGGDGGKIETPKERANRAKAEQEAHITAILNTPDSQLSAEDIRIKERVNLGLSHTGLKLFPSEVFSQKKITAIDINDLKKELLEEIVRGKEAIRSVKSLLVFAIDMVLGQTSVAVKEKFESAYENNPTNAIKDILLYLQIAVQKKNNERISTIDQKFYDAYLTQTVEGKQQPKANLSPQTLREQSIVTPKTKVLTTTERQEIANLKASAEKDVRKQKLADNKLKPGAADYYMARRERYDLSSAVAMCTEDVVRGIIKNEFALTKLSEHKHDLGLQSNKDGVRHSLNEALQFLGLESIPTQGKLDQKQIDKAFELMAEKIKFMRGSPSPSISDASSATISPSPELPSPAKLKIQWPPKPT